MTLIGRLAALEQRRTTEAVTRGDTDAKDRLAAKLDEIARRRRAAGWAPDRTVTVDEVRAQLQHTLEHIRERERQRPWTCHHDHQGGRPPDRCARCQAHFARFGLGPGGQHQW